MPSTKINGVPIISFIKSAGACISKCGGGGTIASSAERLSSRSCRIVPGRARYLAKDPFSDYKSTFLSSALKFLIRTARVRQYNIYIYLVSIAENPILLSPARPVRFVIFSTTAFNRDSRDPSAERMKILSYNVYIYYIVISTTTQTTIILLYCVIFIPESKIPYQTNIHSVIIYKKVPTQRFYFKRMHCSRCFPVFQRSYIAAVIIWKYLTIQYYAKFLTSVGK